MKVIHKEISSCVECEYINCQYEGYTMCNHPDKPEDEDYIDNPDTIPSWCPLPDAEEWKDKLDKAISHLITALGMFSENLGRYCRGEAQAYHDDLFIAMAEELLEMARSQSYYARGVRERMGLKCIDCGLPYLEFGTDMALPDQQWKVICPEGGLLCANCICKRARNHGVTVVLVWLDNLTYKE